MFKMSMKNLQKCLGIFGVVLLFNFIFVAIGISQTYNVATDFSTTNNPNGTWSYGSSASRSGIFSLYNKVMDENGLKKIYHNSSSSLEPSILL